jgi:hypothetical protein
VKRVTVEIPEALLTAMHIYIVAAHSLAKMASDQPKELKGQDPTRMMEMMVEAAENIFDAKPKREQIRLLVETATKLAEASGAASMEAEVREV